jgi:hypothetical protein
MKVKKNSKDIWREPPSNLRGILQKESRQIHRGKARQKFETKFKRSFAMTLTRIQEGEFFQGVASNVVLQLQ